MQIHLASLSTQPVKVQAHLLTLLFICRNSSTRMRQLIGALMGLAPKQMGRFIHSHCHTCISINKDQCQSWMKLEVMPVKYINFNFNFISSLFSISTSQIKGNFSTSEKYSVLDLKGGWNEDTLLYLHPPATAITNQIRTNNT